MVFGLFKDKESIKLAGDISKLFLEVLNILKKIPKDKLDKKNIVEVFKKNLGNDMIASMEAIHEIQIGLNERYLSLSLTKDYSDEKTNYEKYNLSLIGIYDYQGFSIMYNSEDKKPTVGLLDMSKLYGGGKKPGKKAKVLFDEISKSNEFKTSNI